MSGGLYQYLDYCPGYGCIAAEFTRTGALVRAYPYRPDQCEAHQIVALPYEQVFFRFGENMYPHGLLKLPGGDLIVVFNEWNSFPYGGGIARVRPDGSVAWFRHDYSDHWPRLLPDGNIAVPAMRIADSHITVEQPVVWIDLDCDGSRIAEDIVRILTPDGDVKDEISVFDALMRSQYRGRLVDAAVPCDPTHLNYVTPVSQGIQAIYQDVKPDDLVISLFQLSAFGILGRDDHRLKHFFTGSFVHQHSAQPLGQSSTMLMFDNLGMDWEAGPSRLLAYDLATHSEHTLLPNANTPGIRMTSPIEGNVSVSSDQTRVLVASSMDGRAYEVRLSDGEVLTLINDVHDLRKVPAAGGARNSAAAWFALYNLEYVR